VKRQNIVGPQIRKLRYNKGWSQAKLAVEISLKGLDVGREFVAQIEGQTHCAKDTVLPYFARALNVSLLDLFPKFDPACPIQEMMTPLLEERRNGTVLPIVMNSLQLLAGKNGK
jgi:transcriptional regulator with XRE-family HTH domain